MAHIKQYDPAALRQKKRMRIPTENSISLDNNAKRRRVSFGTSNATNGTYSSGEFVDIHAWLSASARMDLVLQVLDVGNLSIAGLLLHRLDSAGTHHYRNTFLAEGGGLETLLKELVAWYPVTEDCVLRAVGHDATLKKVSAEMELVRVHTLLSSTKITPQSMRDWSVEIPEGLAPCLLSILHASAVPDRAAENKVKKDTPTVSITFHTYNGERSTRSNTFTDIKHYYSSARELSLAKFTAVSGAVRALTPRARYASLSN